MELGKLKSFSTASFAVWPFDSGANAKGLHSRLVIIGLNPSARVRFGQNFHNKRFDLWYKEGFSKPPFEGAYMTDLISQHEPDSSVVIKKWGNERFRQNNVVRLQKQFKILGVKEFTPILCIGQNTERLFSAALPRFKNVYSVKHPNSYRMKNKRDIFLRDLKEVRKYINAKTPCSQKRGPCIKTIPKINRLQGA